MTYRPFQRCPPLKLEAPLEEYPPFPWPFAFPLKQIARQCYVRMVRWCITHQTVSYALPSTPQTSFAIAPFSFNRAKKPGLFGLASQRRKKVTSLHSQELSRFQVRSTFHDIDIS